MAYWLATKREGQDTDFIQRFDPRFWTVDFPRPMMASVVTTAPDALRVECEFHHRNALAGLIWESVDRHDHPLLAYDTNRDYARTALSFRWRSSGVLPLDAVHGPTLTIEGKDAAGHARSWFVRLWNYASGAPDDARIGLTFSDLRDGWAADGELVRPDEIERMFISLAPPGYDPTNTAPLPARADGWVELTGIACDGEHAQLVIGDAVLPPHEVGICTAYDDSYNLTPARMLRNMLHLGYRGTYVHYVGMSHYPRLARDGAGRLLADPTVPICEPCAAWHAALFRESAALDFTPIVSLSFELFDAYCHESWKQRDRNGAPALTGWEPPSTLLTPAAFDVLRYLRAVAQEFTTLQMAANLPVHFQIGEPWWWINPDGSPCIYDDAVRAAYPDPPAVDDLTTVHDGREADFLAWLANTLALVCRRIVSRVDQLAGENSRTHILLFTPTLLDPARPAIAAMNLDPAYSADYDVLQVEDYDWLTAGTEALRRRAYADLDARFAYPPAAQHYLSGFVLAARDAEAFWERIDAGVDEALRRGVARAFVWALPQIVRDGYVRLPSTEENAVQSFDDVPYPLALGRDAGVSPEFSTSIALTASGHERRNSQWSDARLHYDVGPGIRSQAELGVLLEFFRARRGPARGFRLTDPFDHSSNALTGTPTPTDQLLGTGNGLAATFRLRKLYGGGEEPQERFITRPRAGTVAVSVDGEVASDWTLEPGGRIVFDRAPPDGAEVRAGFLFDVPVRFAEDRLDITSATFAAGEAPSVPLVELREDV